MLFDELIINGLLRSLEMNESKYAFCIENKYYTYSDLAQSISKIRRSIRTIHEDIMGLVANDDLDTYASIFALWLEGKCYVPLHPEQPLERCENIIQQVGMHYILDSSPTTRYAKYHVLMTGELSYDKLYLSYPKESYENNLAYILFTSGSTGKPKGVPISRSNLGAFVEAFNHLEIKIDDTDRCLQMFDLTFDLSVQSYLLPIIHGACVYTVSPKRIKYEAVFELLDEYDLTMVLMVPSVIHYLHPYLDEIYSPSMRYCFFAGEGLPNDDTESWSKCIPNAEIYNLYGPTENTIYCTAYRYLRNQSNKEINGILSIGSVMKGTQALIVDETGNVTEQKGELCLASPQLTPGYWRNEIQNKNAFFTYKGERYYHTGDICSIEPDGNILYYGRKDSQVKIQGFRIELSEIECVAKRFYQDNISLVALPIYDEKKNCSIHIVVENEDKTTAPELVTYLKGYLPEYMIPQRVHFINRFPLNMNNKIDRKKITTLI
jgi:D-alanine--poly(phosphoribitol) ligase subunit 1